MRRRGQSLPDRSGRLPPGEMPRQPPETGQPLPAQSGRRNHVQSACVPARLRISATHREHFPVTDGRTKTT